MNDCGGCKFCLDKRKFGGPGKLKKRCELRVCMTPRKMGAPSPAAPAKVATTPMTNGNKLPLDVRNKFLTTIENRPTQQNFKIIENPPMLAENRVALENIIEMGLETYEVVNVNIVPQIVQSSDTKPCYICKRDNKEDLFYCSVCCDPFHQFCLHMQSGSGGGGGGGQVQAVSTSTCGRCLGGKGDYEQAMIARAESIHAKCEEIDGTQYQVISFLSDDNMKMPDMILQVEEEEEEEEETVPSLQTPSQLPTYDNDFDAYLHTISLASE